MPVSAEPEDGVPGWYGKIASVGDFASRRLPSGLIARVDDWLQRIIGGSRAQLGESWMNTYLTSPVWRFIVFPEMLDEDAWAGLLMPSCDKVGRYFPLFIAALVPHGEPDSRLLGTIDDWLERIETIALSTLEPQSTLQAFDDALAVARLEPSPESAAMRPLMKRLLEGLRGGPEVIVAAPEVEAMGEAMAFAGAALFNDTARGAAVWWTAARPDRPMRMLVLRELPDVTRYIAMLYGEAE